MQKNFTLYFFFHSMKKLLSLLLLIPFFTLAQTPGDIVLNAGECSLPIVLR